MTDRQTPAPATVDADKIMALADTMAQRLADYLYSFGDKGDVRMEYMDSHAALRAAVERVINERDEWKRLHDKLALLEGK